VKFDIVVAHYREDVRWIQGLDHPSIRRVLLYTKGDPSSDMNGGRVKHMYLPNVGRESHTYIWHCANNLEPGDSDFVFFVQGSPHGMGAEKIKEWIEVVESRGLDHTLNYRICSPYDFLSAGRIRSWAGPTTAAESDVKGWCDKYVKKDARMKSIPIFWNACFGVSSARILSASRIRLATIHQKELSTLNPECGHYCERLWYYIFGLDVPKATSLPEGFWNFYGGENGERHHGIVMLDDSGRIRFYDHFNERTWRMEGDSVIFMDGKGEATAIMKRTSDDEYLGRFLKGDRSVHRISRKVPADE